MPVPVAPVGAHAQRRKVVLVVEGRVAHEEEVRRDLLRHGEGALDVVEAGEVLEHVVCGHEGGPHGVRQVEDAPVEDGSTLGLCRSNLRLAELDAGPRAPGDALVVAQRVTGAGPEVDEVERLAFEGTA
jgi:hypothetical protein